MLRVRYPRASQQIAYENRLALLPAEWPLGPGAKKDGCVRRLANRHRPGLCYKCRLFESFYALTQVESSVRVLLF